MIRILTTALKFIKIATKKELEAYFTQKKSTEYNMYPVDQV
jgi:hypothetical protein